MHRRCSFLPFTSYASKRLVCTVGSIYRAQEALKQAGKKKLSDGDASNFVDFFNVPKVSGKNIKDRAKDFFSKTSKQAESESEKYLMRVKDPSIRAHREAPIFMLGCDLKKQRLVFFSIFDDRIVTEIFLQDEVDWWEVANELVRINRGLNRFIIIPILLNKEERTLVKPIMEGVGSSLKKNGLIPIMHVDVVELATTFQKEPSYLLKASREGSSGGKEFLSEGWFRSHWTHLRNIACEAERDDPITTINRYACPHYTVFVVHLVRAGSRGMNIVLWDPLKRVRFVAKGMLSDILACFLDRHAEHMILIPTNRTDRSILLRCRSALQRAGTECVIVFASEIGERYRKVYQSDPSKYWLSLREVSGTLDIDLLFEVYVAAGNTKRQYQRQILCDRVSKTQEARSQGGDVCIGTEVEKWLTVFSDKKRVAREKVEAAKYTKPLIISYICTDNMAYGQPSNPTVEDNYILATCLLDQKHIVEPWRLYDKRGAFSLPSLDAYDVIVLHNAKQFLLLVWSDPEIEKFLRRGGRIWCTMLAEYLLEAQKFTTESNTLEELSQKYGTLLPASKVTGVAPQKLPLAFFRNHLIAASTGLQNVFAKQLTRSLSQSQLVSIAHRMDALLAMASMEHSGIQIDTEEARQQSKAIKNRLAVIDRALKAFVPREIPLDMKDYFDWVSITHLSALFYGGLITIGNTRFSRNSTKWTSNLIHLCQKFGNLSHINTDIHLQRYAADVGLPTTGKLCTRVLQHIQASGSHDRMKYRIILFDIESTGLNPLTDEIIEIALWDPIEDSSFTTLVNPGRPIQPRTVSIHHITDSMVKDAPTMDQVAQSLVRYLRIDRDQKDPDEIIVLIGHNVFSLDEPMFRRALDRHCPEVDHTDILFCDSLMLLKSQKQVLKNAEGSKRVNFAMLETLTKSLRLSSLMEALRVNTDGDLHRADADTKALWFVLVNAFGLFGKSITQQRDGVLAVAAHSLVEYPGLGCFVPSERRKKSISVNLPGIAADTIKNTKLLSSLQRKPINEATLEILYKQGIKVAGLLLNRINLDRHTSRLFDTEGNQHLSVLHKDGRIRQHIDMTATTTSRTISCFPSCQNIPKDDKSPVRRLFISRFGDQGRCVEIDYSQLEIVVLAILCKDKTLTQDLLDGVDFHIKRAMFFSGIPYEEIYEGYRKGIPKYVNLRKTAKIFSFQRLYGAGVPLLHRTTGIPVKDLEASIEMEDKRYPGISRFHRLVRSVALRPGNPGIPTHFVVELPTGLRMGFKTRDVVLNLPPLKNYPIQGFGAELAQMMVGRLYRLFQKKSFYKDKAFITNFVHDSVWLDCHLSVIEECIKDASVCMSDVKNYVPKTFPGAEIGVPLTVSTSCGVDMCSMKQVYDDFSFISKQKRKPASETPDLVKAFGDMNLASEEEEESPSINYTPEETSEK